MAKKKRETWAVVLIKPSAQIAAYGPFSSQQDAANWFTLVPPAVFPLAAGDEFAIIQITTPLLTVAPS